MKKYLFLILAITLPVSAEELIASGKLSLPKDLAGKAKGIHTVFITIKDPGAKMPMPCAAQKFTLAKDASGEFLDFKLDSMSIMKMACQDIPSVMNLKAKLDKDGNAGPDEPGDIIGTLEGVKKGSKDLTIKMSKVIHENASQAF